MTHKTVEPFRLSDLDGLPWIPPALHGHMRLLAAQSHAWTGRVEGSIVAMAGVTDIYPGMGEAWSYLTPEAAQYPVWLHKAVSAELRRLAPGYRRIQATTDAEHAAGRRWLERLGFEFESVKRLAGPHGETMLNYVLFPNGVFPKGVE